MKCDNSEKSLLRPALIHILLSGKKYGNAQLLSILNNKYALSVHRGTLANALKDIELIFENFHKKKSGGMNLYWLDIKNKE